MGIYLLPRDVDVEGHACIFQCVALPGKRFTQGGYKCECKQGYEYPFNDRAWFFDGQTLEEEWRKKQLGIYNR